MNNTIEKKITKESSAIRNGEACGVCYGFEIPLANSDLSAP